MLCSKIRDSVAMLPTEVLWQSLTRQTRAIQPFVLLTTSTWAKRLGTPDAKLEQHAAALEKAFEWMDAWRSQPATLVKKHANALDSAISYIRNSAIKREVSDLLIAPAARNAAGCLRMCLHIARFNYDDRQLPRYLLVSYLSLRLSARCFLPIWPYSRNMRRMTSTPTSTTTIRCWK